LFSSSRKNEEVKDLTCLATFKTTSAALLFERACRKAGLEVRIVPVPRKLSSSCGLACGFPCEQKAGVETVVHEENLDVFSFHEI
jgi:hypothetical protein